MNYRLLEEDVQQFCEHFELREQLREKTFLITGATGLIGSVMIKCLGELNRKNGLNIKVVAPIRDMEKARKIFGGDFNAIDFVQLPLTQICRGTIGQGVDYIIHLASPTNGKYMESHPVETFGLAYESTKNLLEYARLEKCEGFVYVSSLEYFGQILEDKMVKEDEQGYIDANSPRSSYPLGKRAAEYLCYSYAYEYGVPAKVARLTQTFGAGVSTDDNRVFAQFARSVISEQDIILHTTGESAKPYCYTMDAVSAILYILLKGKNGEAYNVANEETYITIKGMAEYLKEHFNPAINVRVELNNNMGYAPVTKLRLSSQKLIDLGWQPRFGLKEMFERLIKFLV